MIRVLIVDDQAHIRKGLKMQLALEPDIEIIGEADDGVTGVQLAKELQPDVVVMGVSMPRMDGITATEILKVQMPSVQVVILSLNDDKVTRNWAMFVGASAFVEKREGVRALLTAIRSAAGH